MEIEIYCDKTEETYTLEIEVTDFHGGCDAYLSGLPEDCYPGEPSEVEFIAKLDGEEFDIPSHLFDQAYDKVLPLAEQEAVDAYWD